MTYHTHPDYLAHLAGIRANSADDLRRLVLADWLDENGNEVRARRIRQMCEPLVPGVGPRTWEGRDGDIYQWWQRGFLTQIQTPSAVWCEHADRILPESVGLTVRLTTWPEAQVATGADYPRREVVLTADPHRVLVLGDEEEALEFGNRWQPQFATAVLSRRWPDVAKWELLQTPQRGELVWRDGRGVVVAVSRQPPL